MSIDNFSREIEVGQNSVNKSDNFSREIEVGQNNVNKSDNFPREIKSSHFQNCIFFLAKITFSISHL